LKPIKAVIRHLLSVTPAEEIYEALTDLGFDVMSVKQMTSSRRSLPEAGQKSVNVPLPLPLFLITLPKNEKSQEIFKRTGLCHISINVEAYRSSNNLTQYHNCQQFGHVWANCSQPPCCLWCGGRHLHKECPEKVNAASTPACCNCELADEKPHPCNYRGCSHAKEIRRRRSQIQKETTTGRVFPSTPTTPGLSFAAAVRKTAETTQQQPARQPAVAGPNAREQLQPSRLSNQQQTGQSVQDNSASGSHLDNMFRVVTAVQQIMRVQWCCVRRTKDDDHHKNCVKSNEAEWPVEFIGPSKS
jgi:hypothetical protein